jgi:hypothetical protein
MNTVKYITNKNFFDRIDTEEKAYFLGFMYADGNNYINAPHTYEVSIKLQEQDKYILEKFRDLISPKSNIKLYKDNKSQTYLYALRISSKLLCNQLISLGCVPNKSLILEFPNFIEDNLLNHFIRGYFDGDGSIYKRPPKVSGQIDYSVQFISSNKFCAKLKNILENKLNIYFTLRLSKPKTNQITTTISVGGNKQVKRMLDYLYKDATIYLPRKYQKYLDFIEYLSHKRQPGSSFDNPGQATINLPIETPSLIK